MTENTERDGISKGDLSNSSDESLRVERHRQIDMIANQFSNHKWVDPKSTGPFSDGDCRGNRESGDSEIYFKEQWWDYGAFLMGRISVFEDNK